MSVTTDTDRTRRPVAYRYYRCDEVKRIMELVSRVMQVQIDGLFGIRSNTRDRRTVMARRMIVLLARKYTNASFPEIAFALGKQFNNHASAIVLFQHGKRELSSNEEFKRQYDVFVEKLG